MTFENIIPSMLQSVENELRRAISSKIDRKELNSLSKMLIYHMGWDTEDVEIETRGKRIRPLLVMLACAAAGGNWENSLPAAAAVELVHNFSLIHDDIEDKSAVRRGKPTVWVKWGIPQAINTGDALFTLAHLSLLGLADFCETDTTIQAAEILQETCLKLTQGQHLDILYESRNDLSIESYWTMVGGKTAALISACTELGALVAGRSSDIRQSFREFGHFLGMAYQVLDDYIGIWGAVEVTGKSTDSDLVTGKKTLPILFGLHQKGEFYSRWMKGAITQDEVPEVVKQLSMEGAESYTKEAADLLTHQALQALEGAHPQGEAGVALVSLTHRLLRRKN